MKLCIIIHRYGITIVYLSILLFANYLYIICEKRNSTNNIKKIKKQQHYPNSNWSLGFRISFFSLLFFEKNRKCFHFLFSKSNWFSNNKAVTRRCFNKIIIIIIKTEKLLFSVCLNCEGAGEWSNYWPIDYRRPVWSNNPCLVIRTL